MKRQFGRWEKIECDSCGCEYQVTRTESKELDACLCENCETYDRAFKDGVQYGLKLGALGWKIKRI